MAQSIQIILTSDLSPDDPADETIVFGIAGKSYEIDVTTAEGAEFAEIFAPYVAAGRLVAASKVRGRPSAAKAAPITRDTPRQRSGDAAAVRAWGNENGFSLPDRGRIPKNVTEAYAVANASA